MQIVVLSKYCGLNNALNKLKSLRLLISDSTEVQHVSMSRILSGGVLQSFIAKEKKKGPGGAKYLREYKVGQKCTKYH